ncbi:MAG: succinate dehydrogenase assembly factor 2 [Woeseia sp.]
MNDSELRWQCRRGMRELDELLGRYVERCYGSASDAEKAWFRDFLALPDPELARYLLRGEESADGVAARVILQIRSGAEAHKTAS